MTRLLALLPDVPYPLDAGAKIRNEGLLRLLSADHEVDAIAFGAATSGAQLAGLVRSAEAGRSGQSQALRSDRQFSQRRRQIAPGIRISNWIKRQRESLPGSPREENDDPAPVVELPRQAFDYVPAWIGQHLVE